MEDKITKYSAKDFLEKFAEDILDDEFIEEEIPKIGMTWAELSAKEFNKGDELIFGLGRGQVGMLNASTNIGKTTFALNLSLCLVSGVKFLPFTEGQNNCLRVMIIDGENSQAGLQRDLKTMMRDWTPIQRLHVDDNLLLVCDEYINEESPNLTNPSHLSAVVKAAKAFKPDLIIVDPMASLFDLRNENDNAEVKRCVMMPLKTLAKEANAAILLTHHIGKQSEDAYAINPAYSGRGGSNFGALSRTVLKLTMPDKNDKTRVIFSVAKSKGYRQNDVLMVLDKDTRWFNVSDETVPVPISSYDEVLKFITKVVSTKEVVQHFKGKYSRRTIESDIKQAWECGDIQRLRQGHYAPINSAISAPSIDGSGNCGNENDSATASMVNSNLDEGEKEVENLGFAA